MSKIEAACDAALNTLDMDNLEEWLLWIALDVEDGMGGEPDEPPFIDVRLQYHDGAWFYHSGDSSYDQDHRGHWGCSRVGMIDPDDDNRELMNQIAQDMVDQALYSLAMSV